MAKPRLEKVEALFYVLKQVAKGGCIRILIHPLLFYRVRLLGTFELDSTPAPLVALDVVIWHRDHLEDIARTEVYGEHLGVNIDIAYEGELLAETECHLESLLAEELAGVGSEIHHTLDSAE